MADAESESTMQGGVRCCVNELFTERLCASLLLPVGVGTSLLSSRNSGKPDEVGFRVRLLHDHVFMSCDMQSK